MSLSSTYVSTVYFVTALGFGSASLAYAEDIADLFPTGVDENGTALTEGQKDPHYLVQDKAATVWVDEEDDKSTPDVDESANDPVWNQWAGPEAGEGKSSWISTANVFSHVPLPNDVYSFKTTFSIPEGTNLENVRIKMTYAVDNTLVLFLNDEAILEDKKTTVREFRSVFEITGEKHADVLKIGKNVLIFEVRNTETDTVPTPLGLRVQFIAKTLGEAKKCDVILAQSLDMLGNPGFWQGVDADTCVEAPTEIAAPKTTEDNALEAEASTSLRSITQKDTGKGQPADSEAGCSVSSQHDAGTDWSVGLMVLAWAWVRRPKGCTF